MNKIITYILLTLSSIPSYSQVIVEQNLSQVDLLIGEQVNLNTVVLVDAEQKVKYPTFEANTFTQGVEIVREGKIDTMMLNAGKRMQLSRTYKLTSFDSAFYSLPPFYVVVDKDTFKASNILGLKVTSVPVDTTNANEFAGPYSITSIPFQWSYELWLVILVIALSLLFIVLLCKKIKNNAPITKRIVIHPPTPAHQQALKKFAEIKNFSPETEDEFQVYYDKITDTLRQYIEERFSLNAKELTSEEIIHKLTESNNAAALYELKEILATADLVKFAKYHISVSEANRSVAMALDYVNTTRLTEEQLPKPEVRVVTIDEKKQRYFRVALFVVLGTLIILALCLLGYLLMEIYDYFIA